MSDNQKLSDREKVLQLDEEMRDMPMEVRNVIDPVRLTGEDLFRFRCHPGIACFNHCCRKIDIVLTPYDLIRLRRRLNLTSEEFLHTYARPSALTKGQLPVPLIDMDSETGRCPFNSDEGCSVYSDRPVACRYYPIGSALMRRQESDDAEEFYFLIKEGFCLGHAEAKEWTVADWRSDQGSDGYDRHNRGWMETILKRRSAGDMVGTSVQTSELFYMAGTNPEAFRRFVFDSTFLKRFEVAPEVERLIAEDDVAMTEFAFEWLKGVLFGDRTLKVRPEALAEVKAKEKKSSRRVGPSEGS
ncbi:MAG: YkgJ family cysteine cluster protein [Magnetococcales bacterium]|nr:YkgJ family cysteine cluster protein [Magnetococcales bacterium]MBF0156671.1 YkgJ family cysteine cluster protein [Magnetococcales bacterium]